jgi:hypothetical protein
LSTRKPSARIDNEITDDPRLVIEIEILDVANGAVGRADDIALKIRRIA